MLPVGDGLVLVLFATHHDASDIKPIKFEKDGNQYLEREATPREVCTLVSRPMPSMR